MTTPCVDCGRTDRPRDRRIRGWTMCHVCTRRRREHPTSCPSCGNVRVLALPLKGRAVCADCAGEPPPLACPTCGEETHPYGKQCAYCTLAARATDLLTDPTTGGVNEHLRPLLNFWTSSDDPRTQIRWLSHAPLSTELLRRMACGEVPVSHETFQTLPPAKPYDYLRNLLTVIGILGPWTPHIDRFTAWVEHEIIPTLADEHVPIIRRYARWHILRGLQRHDRDGTLTQAVANSARIRIRAAIEFCELLAAHDVAVEDATQAYLDKLIASTAGYDRVKTIASFIAWMRKTRINTNLTAPSEPWPHATVTLSAEQRWADVERLLHGHRYSNHVRLVGLFTLLFAQPLNRIVAMTTDQIDITEEGVFVTFAEDAIQMPPVLDNLVRAHLENRIVPTNVNQDPGWLFPGAQPGHHLVTEVFRRDLNAIGIKPHESRKAAMFDLASTIPAPVLAGLLGITDRNAATWAQLAARDWHSYIHQRDSREQR